MTPQRRRPSEPPRLPDPLPEPSRVDGVTDDYLRGSVDYWRRRAERGEQVGLYFSGEADNERELRELNAATQARCVDWARSLGSNQQ